MKFRCANLILVWASTLAVNSAENEPALPTSLAPLEEAVISSQAVMVCRLVDLGFTDFHGPGESSHDSAVFEVVTQLKGTSSQSVTCSFRRTVFPPKIDEKLPEVGKDYILAGASAQGVFKIEKLIAATPNNIAEVKRLLGESIPIGKNIFKRVPTQPGTAATVVSTPAVEASALQPIVQTPAVPSERNAPLWPWVIGVPALALIGSLLWKRRT